VKGLVRNVPVWGTVSDNLTLEYRRLGTSISANIDKVNSLYIYISLYRSLKKSSPTLTHHPQHVCQALVIG